MAEVADETFERLWEAAQGGDAAAQLAVGRHYLAADDFGRARRWLGRAGRGGEPGGLTELAMMMLQGLGVAADPSGARTQLEEARERGDVRARYELALLDFRTGRRTTEPCLGELAAAARAGHPPARRQVALLLARDDPPQSHRLLATAAAAGDALAASLLARALADEDPAAATAWAHRAAAQGSYCRTVFAPLGDPRAASRAAAPAGPAGPAELPEPPVPDAGFEGHARRPLGDDRVRLYDGILSPLECEYLIETAAPHLRPSHTVHPETGEAVRNELRTSDGYSLHPVQEDFVILAVKARLAARTGFPVSHAEPFALLRYREGQEYREHYDFIDPASGEAGREIGRFGQREVTIFSYLSTVEHGGETKFPRHDFAVPCRQGRALLFHNTLSDGRVDLDSLHASVPVTQGEKWIATLWVRSRPVAR